MSKIKIAISSIFYPLFMGKYIIDAFKRRDDVEVFTVGPYTGNWIPWSGGITLNNRYAQPPDLPLGRNLIGTKPHPAPLENALPWKPDLFLMIDAGFHFRERPIGDMVVLIETIPTHCTPITITPASMWIMYFQCKPHICEMGIFICRMRLTRIFSIHKN